MGGAGKAGGCGSNQGRREKIFHVHSLKIRPLRGLPCFLPIRATATSRNIFATLVRRLNAQ
jgi:hypothetical protein